MKVLFQATAITVLSAAIFSCGRKLPESVYYVNPYMGNISHLLVPTYPTVHLPNSMLRFYPNRENFTSNTMRGFPLNVISLRKGEPETCPKMHPFEKSQSVAITLASCYDDWCMAQMARELGKEEDYNFFIKRTLNYRNLFNSETGFYHPKDSLGSRIEPFDYRFDGGMGARNYYDENNGWTYIRQPYHASGDLISMKGKRKLSTISPTGFLPRAWGLQ